MSQLAALQATPAQAAALYQSQEKLGDSSGSSLFADMLTAAQAAEAVASAASGPESPAAARIAAATAAGSAAAPAAQAADIAAVTTDTAAAASEIAAPAETAAAAAAETAATAASARAASSGSSMLSSILPFFLASMSSGSGGQAMLMLLALALVADSGDSGEGDSLISDMFSAMSDNGGNFGTSLLTSSLMGTSGLWGSGSSSYSGGLWGTDSADSSGLFGGMNASSMATMAAAQSMMQAYRNVQTGTPSPYATGTVPLMDDDGNITTAATPAANTNFSTYTTLGEDTDEPVGSDKAPGRRVTPEVMSTVGNRSPSLYRQVIDQFDVENNPRYAVNQKGTGDTYCNIFMWDVTCAMGAEIPHHTDWDTGAPLSSGGKSMNANRISDWLNTYGPQYGWYEVTPEQAQALANRGSPAVTVWKNPSGGHGHVQVVSPSENGSYDPEKGVAIAQAGTNLRNYTYITNIYSSRMKEVQYFAHR